MFIGLCIVSPQIWSMQKQNDNLRFMPDEKIIYKNINGIELALNVFNSVNQDDDSKPAIVFFFGGGWVNGNPKQFYEQARYFANKGFWVASAEYRIYSKHQTSPFESVADAKSAIRWIREHASDLGIDPNKIVAAGGSAGGHLAATTGIISGYEQTNEDLSISSKPNAMILLNPVIDTTENGYGVEKVGARHKTTLSPVHHVHKGIAPTLVLHGTADTIVPFENVARFHKQMVEAGNRIRLVPYEGKKHGFFNGAFFRQEKADISSYEDSLEQISLFLASLDWLNK